MKNIYQLIIAGIVICVALVISGAVYTIDETQQVVITQFGEPIGRAKTEAGLYLKTPFIQVANYFEKRILQWDGDPNQIPTLDKRYIWVDTTARFRIVDALKFMQSVGTIAQAHGRLDDVIDAATRDAISSSNLIEAVRDSNRILDVTAEKGFQETITRGAEKLAREKIKFGREGLTRKILKNAQQIVPRYGLELVDVRIKRINYVQEVQKKVYERMISERKRAAEKYRSEGQGQRAEIEGQRAKELQEIRSQAYKTAQEIRGKADAKAIKIYADAYSKDPEFYAFLKTLETYQSTIDNNSSLILSTDSDYFTYLKSIEKSGTITP